MVKKICEHCDNNIDKHAPVVIDFLYYQVDGWVEVYYHVECLLQLMGYKK